MDRSKLFSKLLGVIAIAALSLGLTACGSGSSSDSTGSASAVVHKGAGPAAKDVFLKVTNKSGVGLQVLLCNSRDDSKDCGYGIVGKLLHTGESISTTAYAVGGIISGSGGRVGVKAFNPDVGEPYIHLWEEGEPTSDKTVRLSEGQTAKVAVAGAIFDLWRLNDTDVKVMGIDIRD